jgi:hypothetical protein
MKTTGNEKSARSAGCIHRGSRPANSYDRMATRFRNTPQAVLEN